MLRFLSHTSHAKRCTLELRSFSQTHIYTQIGEQSVIKLLVTEVSRNQTHNVSIAKEQFFPLSHSRPSVRER